MKCIVCTSDLILAQQVANALHGSGWSTRTIASLAELRPLTSDAGIVAIVDLNRPIEEIKQASGNVDPDIQLIGVASHVHTEKIQAARESGFRTVLTRGQLSGHLAAELAKLISHEQ